VERQRQRIRRGEVADGFGTDGRDDFFAFRLAWP